MTKGKHQVAQINRNRRCLIPAPTSFAISSRSQKHFAASLYRKVKLFIESHKLRVTGRCLAGSPLRGREGSRLCRWRNGACDVLWHRWGFLAPGRSSRFCNERESVPFNPSAEHPSLGCSVILSIFGSHMKTETDFAVQCLHVLHF